MARPSRPADVRSWLRCIDRLASFPHVAEASPSLVRETVARWRQLFADPRFALPASAVPSGSVDGAAPCRLAAAGQKKTVVTEMTA